MELRRCECGEGLHVPSTCGLTFSQYGNLRKVTWKLRVANKNVPSNKMEIASSFLGPSFKNDTVISIISFWSKQSSVYLDSKGRNKASTLEIIQEFGGCVCNKRTWPIKSCIIWSPAASPTWFLTIPPDHLGYFIGFPVVFEHQAKLHLRPQGLAASSAY